MKAGFREPGNRPRRLALRFACVLVLLLTLHPIGAQDADAVANQKKARATLDAMVAALGGQRWLTLTSTMQQGRTSGFYQGKPTGMTAEFYEIQKFPDQTRVELGKKRDVVEIISGDQAWEITYKGKKELPKDQVQDLIRRRDHSLQTAMRVWLNDPRTVLIYGGQTLVERHLADRTTLINAENDSIYHPDRRRNTSAPAAELAMARSALQRQKYRRGRV